MDLAFPIEQFIALLFLLTKVYMPNSVNLRHQTQIFILAAVHLASVPPV